MNGIRRYFGHDGEGGQALVMVAIVFLALLFAVGLSIDAGQLFVGKRSAQEAADAGAFAGAVVLYQGGTAAQAISAATADVSTNGYTNNVNGATVTVNSPPASGPFVSDVNHVEVIIVSQVKTSLVPAAATFNSVRARGVAGAESLNNGYALMALSTSCASAGLTVTSTQSIHLYGGGAMINSCNASAVSGFSSTQALLVCALAPAPCTPNSYTVDVVGGTVGNSFPAGITVRTGLPPVPDPFAGYAKPDGHSYNGVNLLPTNPANIVGTTTAVEGIYTTQLSGVALCHGIYILKGVGMAASGGNITQDTNPAHVDPNTNTPCDGRVLIYNAMSGFPSSIGTCANMVGTTGFTMTIQPMTSGPFANMSIYQDPACAASLKVGGENLLNVGGTIYMPSGTVSFADDSGTINGGQIIANQINLSDVSSGALNITYSAATTATPRLPRLAE